MEYLVFKGTEAILAKNPYIDRVHVIPAGSKNPANALRLFRRFDFSLATNPSDRAILFAALAGRRSVGFSYHKRHEWWKRVALDAVNSYEDGYHVVPHMLTLLDPLGIEKVPVVTIGFGDVDRAFAARLLPASGYVLLHPYSRGTYKFWPAPKWGALAALIAEQTSLTPVFTMTGQPADAELLREILHHAPPGCRFLPEPFSLNQLAAALSGSAAYVGIDTVVTHVAAAAGVPTFALFGPTLTRYWAPWPNGCPESSPFPANHGVQRVGNVTVIQQDWSCASCNNESCYQGDGSVIKCLEELETELVFQILRDTLGGS